MPGRPLHFMNALTLVQRLLEDRTNMFVSAVLTPESQRRLLERVPPVHPVVYAHHVTMAFNPDAETLARYQSMEGQRIRVPVTAVCVDEKAQAVLVGVESENEYPHITVSVAEGVKPAYSNELLAAQRADLQHVNIFTLEADVVIEPLDSTPA
jgi:hypothetical protein